MAYSGAPQQQLTAEEIAYWASLGYYYDPAYAAPNTAPPTSYDYSSQPYGAPSGPSIPSRGYQGGNRQGYEYEDLNKIFVDPKKAKEEADAAAAKAEADAKAAKDKAAATVVRSAAGQTWQDPTLLEFDESKSSFHLFTLYCEKKMPTERQLYFFFRVNLLDDFRLFAGDLGNEITDDVLSKTFSKYPSFLKAKVVRDKKTQKSKGYGFISFADAEDFARAWKEMDGNLNM